jgi:hypothetical protein
MLQQGAGALATGRSRRGAALPVPAVEMPSPPSLMSACDAFAHTEMGGGTVVGGGANMKLGSASECCQACHAHNTQVPRPRGRRNCTTWVYNSDPTHHQARECWFKSHDAPWADIDLLAGGAKSWTTGLAVEPPPRMVRGLRATSRSCGDDRWKRPSPTARLFQRPATLGVHAAEVSFCAPVLAAEADFALKLDSGRSVRIRLNREYSPRASAWIDSLLDAGTCANRSRCQPHCCNFYRGEAAVGVHKLPDSLIRAHRLDPAALPAWGRGFYWGPPYAFIQGRLWHGGPGPWKTTDTSLPSEGTLPTLHRGTVELVGGGPDFLIALADHPMMPPHNVFAHVVEADMQILDELIERGPLKVQNWGSINATVFEKAQPFLLRRIR